MIDNDEPIVRIAYLEIDRAPQASGYEAFHAILDPAPSARWMTTFERLLATASSLLRGATFRSFRGNVTVWVTTPEQSMSAAIQGLKSLVLDVSARTSMLGESAP
jgi:hypothetical protein